MSPEELADKLATPIDTGLTATHCYREGLIEAITAMREAVDLLSDDELYSGAMHPAEARLDKFLEGPR